MRVYYYKYTQVVMSYLAQKKRARDEEAQAADKSHVHSVCVAI